MKAQHSKILTLIDVQEPIDTIIKSTVNLAKTFDAEVKFLYVQKSMDTTKTENQIAVIQDLTQQRNAIARYKILVKRARKLQGLKLDFAVVSGPLKKTIQSEVETYQPDLIVLGKRRPNLFRIIGREVTDFVLKIFDGPLLIAHPTKVLEIKEDLSLGVLNDLSTIEENDVSNALIEQSKKPVKYFSITDDASLSTNTNDAGIPIISFIFENNQNAMKNVTNYVHKNDVQLLFLGRTNQENSNKNVNLREAMKRINTSMLMIGNNRPY